MDLTKTITREQLVEAVSALELAAQRDPSAYTFDTPEAKAALLWEMLSVPRPRKRLDHATT